MKTQSPQNPQSPVQRLYALLAQERGEIGLVYLYAVLAGLLGLALPLGVQAIIGLVAGGMLLQPVVILITAVVVGTAFAGVVQVLQVSAVERLQQRIFARLAIDWGARIPQLHPRVASREYLPETVTRFFEVVIIQKTLAKLLIEAVAAVLAIMFGLLLLMMYHPSLGISGILLLAAFVLTLWLTGKHAYVTSYAESTAKYRVAHWLQELARHFALFRSSPDSRLPVERTDDGVAEYLHARQDHFRVIIRQSMAAVVFKTLITGALLVLGTMLVVNRQITLGQFVASELVVVMVLSGVEKLILNLGTVYDLLTSVTKASHVSELELLHDAHGRATPPAPVNGSVVAVTNLGYRFESATAPAIQSLALAVGAGERVAITGPEGAGTSTLLQTIAGLLPDYSGVVTIDGVSLRDYAPKLLRARVAYVESSPALIDATVADNIGLGRASVSEADVLWALELAGALRFVNELPLGIRTVIGGEVTLPLQTLRRIGLARAIVTRPSLLLVDRFFHHLSPRTKAELIARLCDPAQSWTILAASHDPLFLRNCDRVVLMDRGEITRIDAPQTLLGESALQPHLTFDADATH